MTGILALKLNVMPNLWWLLYLPFAFAWSLIFWKCYPERRKVPNIYWLIEVVAMICGLVWTYFLIGGVIDLLLLISVISKLSLTYLALTIIGFGNALPDTLLTISLAKKG